MKKYYLLLLFTYIAQAQIINIPDANFKATLLLANASNGIARNTLGQYIVIDANGNSEVEISEALEVSDLYVNNRNITSLQGIEYFTNISLLDCSFNQITTLDLTNNVAIQNLFSSHNSINITVLPNFIYPIIIDLSYNALSNINLSNISQLVSLFLNNNNLTSIVFDNPNYTFLVDGGINVSHNPLVNLDLGQLKNSPMQMGEPFDSIEISNTLLTQIICPSVTVKYYYIDSNPNLELISFKNQKLENFVDNDFDTGVSITNNPNLSMICVDNLSGVSTSEQQFFENYLNNPSILVSATVCNLGNTAEELLSSFVLYPNPTAGELQIDLPSGTNVKTITIYNTLGKKTAIFTNTTKLDVSTLSQGTYFITVETESEKVTQRFVKL